MGGTGNKRDRHWRGVFDVSLCAHCVAVSRELKQRQVAGGGGAAWKDAPPAARACCLVLCGGDDLEVIVRECSERQRTQLKDVAVFGRLAASGEESVLVALLFVGVLVLAVKRRDTRQVEQVRLRQRRPRGGI